LLTTRRRILSALLGGRVDRVPAYLPVVATTVHAMEASKTYWPDAHWDPEKMARLAAATYELTGLPTTTLPFCLSVEAEALGCPIDKGRVDRTPSVLGPAFKDVDNLKIPEKIVEKGRIPVALEAIEILREKVSDKIPLTVKVTGPFTIAGHVFGVDRFVSWVKTNPEKVEEALDKLAYVSTEFASAATRSGVDIVTISDPTSSGDLISADTYRDLVAPAHKKVFSKIDVPCVLHICGNTSGHMKYIPETDVDCFSFEEKVDVAYARQVVGNKISLVGNIAPVSVLLQGSIADVERESLKALRAGIDILSSGCTIAPRTPLENIRMLLEVAEKFKLEERAPVGLEAKPEAPKARAVEPLQLVKDIMPKDEPYGSISEAVLRGDETKTRQLCEKALKQGSKGVDIVNLGLLPGVQAAGKLYNEGLAYVPEILLANSAMQAGLAVCKEELAAVKKLGTILVHCADGDVHDIGKNIVKAIVSASGFEVIDLGKSVPPETVAEAIKKYKPIAVLGSALMTTTRPAFVATAKKLKEEGVDIVFGVGGGALDKAFAETASLLVYGKDPGNAVQICKLATQKKKWEEVRRALHG